MQNLITLYTESTPNPDTMKFVSNRYILPDETLDYTSAEQAKAAPMAEKLFEFPFVAGVFISQNFVTITRKAGEDWAEINPMLKDFIQSYLEAGLPIYQPAVDGEVEVEDDRETVKRIKQILKDYIQPAVEQDGGAISYKAFDEASGQVTVELRGSCSGCPSSMITLKAGIENLLKRMLPEVKEVVAA
jgi:NFU1 iron-sulfur cluster scaffold homolog, mitochondrial